MILVSVQLTFDNQNRFVTLSRYNVPSSIISSFSLYWFVAKQVDKNIVYLVFRGSSSLNDLFIDFATKLDTPEVKFYFSSFFIINLLVSQLCEALNFFFGFLQYSNEYMVHHGIHSTFIEERQKIVETLCTVMDSDTTLYITGKRGREKLFQYINLFIYNLSLACLF